MMLFKIECQYGNDKYVFAGSEQGAVEQFVTWQMVNEAPMGDFLVKRVTISSQTNLGAVHLREALRSSLQGIGIYSERRGWEIRPIEDERPDNCGG